MAADTDTLPAEGLPAFLAHTERLKTALQGMSRQELQSLWKCNDAITAQNAARLADMDRAAAPIDWNSYYAAPSMVGTAGCASYKIPQNTSPSSPTRVSSTSIWPPG